MPCGCDGLTVGVVGGGQLGRMLGEAAAPLGVELIVLDPTPDAPAAPVVRDQIVAAFDDQEALQELAERADVLTFEIEIADAELLEQVEDATGVPVHPRPQTLQMISDKLVQKKRLEAAGIPVPPFRPVASPADLEAALDELGSPVMLKARRGGYDGRGNLVVEEGDDLAAALDAVGGDAMAEAFVDYDRELSIIGCIGADEHDMFPVTETIHEEEILRQTVTPARTDEAVQERAREVAGDVLDVMEGRGVYGIELFEADGDILLNEIAPRPHNSGHWTIEGAATSQFAQHIRAVTGQPLGATTLRRPTVTTNILGDVSEERPARLAGVDDVLETSGAALHWYGKDAVRPLRKMGHVTLTDRGEPVDDLLETAQELTGRLTFRRDGPR